MSDEQPRVRIRVEYDPAYRIAHVNGGFGGPTPRGDLKFDFFVEYREPPEAFFYEPDDQGGVDVNNPVATEPEQVDIVRIHQFGMILSAEHARSIGAWMQKRAEELLNSPDDSNDKPMDGTAENLLE